MMERRKSGHFPKVWRGTFPAGRSPSSRIGSAQAAGWALRFLVILFLRSLHGLGATLHLSLKTMEWEPHVEKKLCPGGKAALIIAKLHLKG